jgi:hypothetical protein
MMTSLLLFLSTLAGGEEGFTEPLKDEKSPAEYGHKLSKEDALAGWIALFDGKTAFGFKDGKVENGKLIAGKTTSPFREYFLRVNAVRPGKLRAGEKQTVELSEGLQLVNVAHPVAFLELTGGLEVTELSVQPANVQPLMNGRDLLGWKAIPYPKARPDAKVTWEPKDGFVLAKGGPGALEYWGPMGSEKDASPPLFQDFILQADVRTAEKHTNGGIFLRNQPGTVMMGYEAQLHNRVYDTRAGVSGCCTGSIDDRQHARKLVCRDGELFRLTAVVAGPHISIWVNGHQTADWTDTRPADENPRKGLRLAGGTLQLQAHDPETNLEFHQVLLSKLGGEKKP